MEDNERLFLIMAGIGAFILCILIAGVTNSYTYENVTGNITDKWEDDYTSMVAYSAGSAVGVIPVSHHDYWIETTYGNIKVGMDTYNNYSIGDKINLTRNVNTTEVYLR